MASVADYLGSDLDDSGRQFLPSTELVAALDAESTAFGRHMAEAGCPSERGRIPDDDETIRQGCGYPTATIRAAMQAHHDGRPPPGTRHTTRHSARQTRHTPHQPVTGL